MGHFRHFLLLLGVAVICVGNIPLPLLLVAVLVAILFSDADLTLTLATKMGKQPSELRGRVVWITGASSGIGEKLAYELARAGAKLVLSARRNQELERVKAKCEGEMSGQSPCDDLSLPQRHAITLLFLLLGSSSSYHQN